MIGTPGRADQGASAPSARRSEALSAAQTDSVPISALQMPDDQEQMQPPEVGDVVNYQVAGKVLAINGDMAQVQRTSINGQPVSSDSSDSDANPDKDGDDNSGDADERALQTEAQGLDSSGQVFQ